MMANNQAEDRYNPPATNVPDFEEMRFDEIDGDDLFWLQSINSDNNPAYRKLNDYQAYNTKTTIVQNFEYNAVVYQRN